MTNALLSAPLGLWRGGNNRAPQYIFAMPLCAVFMFSKRIDILRSFAFVQAEGDMVERRLQFDDSRLSTMTTTYVPQSESEVKGEEVNTTISHTGALVTEVTKRPQSDDALPSSRLDEKIGVLKKNENSASAASQGTYHPLEDPPSLPYPTSPFDRQDFHFHLRFLKHEATGALHYEMALGLE